MKCKVGGLNVSIIECDDDDDDGISSSVNDSMSVSMSDSVR